MLPEVAHGKGAHCAQADGVEGAAEPDHGLRAGVRGRGGGGSDGVNQRGFGILAYLIIVLAVLGTLSTIAYKIHDAGYQQAKAECEQAAQAQRDKEQQQAHTAGSILETDNAKARVVYRTITKAVDRYIDRPVYRNVCLDSDGLSSVNAALREPGISPAEPDKPMPKPDAPGGRDRSISAEKAN